MESEEKFKELQMLEQNMQALHTQKHVFESQLIETNSALGALEGKKQAHKIIGNIMVEADVKELTIKLSEESRQLSSRVKTLAKQEEELGARAKGLQEDIMNSMKE